MTSHKNLIQQLKDLLETEMLSERVPECEGVITAKTNTKKQQVIDAVLKRCQAVSTDDLPKLEKELMAYFERYKNADYFSDYYSQDYFRLMDFRGETDERIVVIGDIHCDYNSLAAILLKLSVSSYDYFEKGRFVFLGDYLDRGSVIFEPLLLLMDLQQILGERMIMLRGNHELISYNEEILLLESKVIPQDSCPALNEYCGENKDFLKAFGNFFRTLPTYAYLKLEGQNILLTHAAVPRQVFLDKFSFDQESGAIVFDPGYLYDAKTIAQDKTEDDSLKTMTTILRGDLLMMRNRILYDMIWGDPSPDWEKYQVSGRYQFGLSQFDAYAKKNNISRLFRSHEPVKNGFMSFFDNRLYTIFSTGGTDNDQTGYGNIDPAFAIIHGSGDYFVENSYLYGVHLCSGILKLTCNPFAGSFPGYVSTGDYAINEEFLCDEKTILEIESIFMKVKEGFIFTEEPEEEEPAEVLPEPEKESEPEPELKSVPEGKSEKEERKDKSHKNKSK